MVVEPHIDPRSLTRITCPTCIMSGALDEIPPTETARIADAIPGTRKVVVPGAEHTLPKVAPEAVLRELLVTIAAAEHLSRGHRALSAFCRRRGLPYACEYAVRDAQYAA